LQNTISNVASSIGVAIFGTIEQTHSNLSFATYMQHLSGKSLQQVSTYGLHPSVYGITNPADLLQLLSILKQQAFQSAMHYTLSIVTVFFTVAVFLTLFVGKKQKFDGATDKHSAAAEV